MVVARTTKPKTESTKTGNGNGNGNDNENSNGNGNGKKAQAKAKPAPVELTAQEIEQEAEQLVKQIRQAVHSKYKVALPMRNTRILTRLFYGAKELLGMDINAQVRKKNGTMDWQSWNTKVVPALLGTPEKLKHDPKVLVMALAKLYDQLSLDPEQGVLDLVEYNQQSLERRNQFKKKEEELEDDDLDDEDEDLDDEDLDDENEDDEDDDELADL